jgi:hypothetical protein
LQLSEAGRRVGRPGPEHDVAVPARADVDDEGLAGDEDRDAALRVRLDRRGHDRVHAVGGEDGGRELLDRSAVHVAHGDLDPARSREREREVERPRLDRERDRVRPARAVVARMEVVRSFDLHAVAEATVLAGLEGARVARSAELAV